MNEIKQKTYRNILVGATVILALFFIENIYLVQQEENLSLEMIGKKQEMEKLKKYNEQIADIRNIYDNMREKMDEVHNSVIDPSKIVDFIVEIENTAKKNNIELEINIANKDKESLDKNFSRAYYKIKASGNFDDIMKFLASIENLRYYSDIENIKMSSMEELGGGDSDMVELNSDLTVYTYSSDGQ